MKTLFRCLSFGIAMAVMVAGCVSTPEQRIARNQDLFASFSPEVQEQVRAGKVVIGFTPEMVRMALGAPDRIHARTTAAGESEVWTYIGIIYDSSMQPVDGSYVYRDRYGHLRRAYDTSWVTVNRSREYPVIRLEFEGGKVKVVERAK